MEASAYIEKRECNRHVDELLARERGQVQLREGERLAR
jgi:hypothetical protein